MEAYLTICAFLDFWYSVAVTLPVLFELQISTSHLLSLCYLKVHCVDLDKGKGFLKQAFWVQISEEVSDIDLYYDI